MAALVGAGTNPAHGDPLPPTGKGTIEPKPFSNITPEVYKKMIAQQPLSEAANIIRSEVEKEDSSGYASIALMDKSVELRWKGEISTKIKEAITEARGIAQVDIKQVRYSRAELRRATAGIAKKLKEDPSYPIVDVAFPGSGDGVVLRTSGSIQAAKRDAAAYGLADIPVTVLKGEPLEAKGRGNDSPAYYGGGVIRNDPAGPYKMCTSGWAVTDNRARSYLLTAGHCGDVGDGFHNGDWTGNNDGLWIGRAVAKNTDHDLLLIDAPSAGYIWDGSYKGDFIKHVKGGQWTFPYEWVCHSGSSSGAICGFQNDDYGHYLAEVRDVHGRLAVISDLVHADQVEGRTAAIGGDSGGPVFSLHGAGEVYAKGTIVGCSSWAPTVLIYQDFGQATMDFNIWAKD